jgi:hypothetical protein
MSATLVDLEFLDSTLQMVERAAANGDKEARKWVRGQAAGPKGKSCIARYSLVRLISSPRITRTLAGKRTCDALRGERRKPPLCAGIMR